MQGKPTAGKAAEVFWQKVAKTDGCWTWQGTTVMGSHGSGPYGQFHAGGGRPGIRVYAHRFAYELLVGPIAPGLVLDHGCDNTLCVNPGHLEAVPESVNILRGRGASAVNARRTHCKWGHELAGDNVYFRTNGARVCRACARDRARSYYRRNRDV